MNYIELEIQEKKRGFKLGLGFLGELLEVMDIDVSELQTKLGKNPFKIIPLMMFNAYKYDCERKGNTMELSQNDFIDYVEDKGFESSEIMGFINTFTKSMVKDVPKSDSKKKVA